MLEVTNLSVVYANGSAPVTALRDTSLQLKSGEFVAVRGPSGCGKSTLLLSAGGLLAPATGVVRLAATDLYEMGAKARARFRAAHVGFVFQQFHLIPYLSVRDNIRAATLGSAAAESAGRADELIARFGLAHRADHRPAQLSTGERQRVGLARAMWHQPLLLLADEPTGNLDEDNSTVVLRSLREHADGGGIVLMVTHDQQAAAAASRVLEMRDGHFTTHT